MTPLEFPKLSTNYPLLTFFPIFYIKEPFSNRLRPCPHWCVFVWDRIHFDAFRPSVHTKTLSVFGETASMWKPSRKWIEMKTHRYGLHENSSVHTKTLSVFAVTENEAKWKRFSADINLIHTFPSLDFSKCWKTLIVNRLNFLYYYCNNLFILNFLSH